MTLTRIWNNPIPAAVRCLIWPVVSAAVGGAFLSASAPISSLLGFLSSVAFVGFVVLIARRLWIFATSGRTSTGPGQPATDKQRQP